MTKKKLVTSGKRKEAVAKAVISEGDGKITINKVPYENLREFNQLSIQEPIELTKQVLGNFNFNISVKVKGGGEKGQIEASRLAIAKSLYEFTGNEKLKKAFHDYDKNLLVADIRRKETYKPGDSKARRKRQKSYR